VTYPAQDLVRLLAALLQQIASANDVLRKEEGDEGKPKAVSSSRASGREDSAASSSAEGSRSASPSAGRRRQQGAPRTASQDVAMDAAEDDADDGRPMSRPPSLESTSSAASNQSEGPPRTPTDPLGHVPAAASTPRTSFEAASSSSPHPASLVGDASMASSSSSAATATANSRQNSTPTPTAQAGTITPPSSSTAPLAAPKHLSASLTAFRSSSSSLCFHARNVPGINIEVYLQRILKYCPASNEVFLSLLVYFDRMSKLSMEVGGKPFAIDSFNVHRLVIAGVTVASKFFSGALLLPAAWPYNPYEPN
jgi:hypothetical protein